VVEEGETEPVQMLQPVGYRRVGNEAVSPTHADGSAVASLPKALEKEPMKMKILLVQMSPHL
jgi:hypothetical protein